MREFSVDTDLLAAFTEFGESKGITVKKDPNDKSGGPDDPKAIMKAQFAKDLDYIKALIKAQIARSLFGNEGFFRALLTADAQFQKALMLFPEARKIAGIK